MDGGAGFDRAIFSDASGPLSINMASGGVSGNGTDTLQSIELVSGSDYADTYNAVGFNGGSANAGSGGTFNEFEGRGGDDVITGNGATRVSYLTAAAAVAVSIASGTGQSLAGGDAAGVGTDTFTGVSQVRGSAYDDVLSGSNAGNEQFEGRGGSDTINGLGGLDRARYDFDSAAIQVDLASGSVTGGDAGVGNHDTLQSIELIRGSSFDDTYDATGFSNVSTNAGSNGTFNEFEGMAGNDTITGNGATQIVFYNATGGVTVDLAAGTVDGDGSVGHDTISGGVMQVIGSGYGDLLQGSANPIPTPETFEGRSGNDTIDGRAGFDRAIYGNDPSAQSGIAVNMAAGTVTGDAAIGNDTLISVESVFGTNYADAYDATNFHGASVDIGNGDDFNEFQGLGGNDTITGNGNTRISYANANGAVTVDLQAGTADGNGSVGHDTFTGVSRARGSGFGDTISGDGNDNRLEGWGGNDAIDGRGGFDFALYSNDNRTVSGINVNLAAGTVTGDFSVGTDTLQSIEGVYGTAFADTFDATGFGGASTNAGSNGTLNEFEGWSGDDTVIGNGTTRITFNMATSGVNVDLAAGTADGDASVGHDTLSGVDAVSGSLFDDTLKGDSGSNTLTGKSGADIFIYSDGADTVADFDQGQSDKINLAGSGITGWSQLLPMISQSGSDTLISFGAGNSITLTGVTATNLTQNDFVFETVNTVIGDGNRNILTGTAGADLIQALGGDDDLQGLAGNDTLEGGSGFDRAVYTDATGSLTIDLAAGTASGLGVGTDTLHSIEMIQGSDSADTFTAVGFGGGSTNAGSGGTFNEFEGMGGDDTITGNGGTRVSYLHATGGVTVNLGTGTSSGDGSVGTDTFSGVNAARGSQFDDTLIGSNFGTEQFEGRGGDDLINGMGGFDRVRYEFESSGVTINLAAGTVTGASAGTDTLNAIESIRGSNSADTFDATGFSGSSTNAGSQGTFNEFEGMGGNDTITGNGSTQLAFYNATAGVTVDLLAGTVIGDASVGSDTILGGVVNLVGSQSIDSFYGSSTPSNIAETFDGRAGNDTFDGRGGFDRVIYNNDFAVTSGISVDMAAGTVIGDAAIGSDTLVSIESVRGTNFADTYVATGFNGASTDTIPLGATFNEFEGMGGNDTITGNGNTRISFQTTNGAVTIDLAAGTATGDATVGTDTFTGVSRARGGNGNDTISGDANNNVIEGQNGNDVITGAGGNDILTGGAGADTFIFDANAGADVITDFTAGSAGGHDFVDFSVTVFADYAAVSAAMIQDGSNVVISDGVDMLTINNVIVANLVSSDFLFH